MAMTSLSLLEKAKAKIDSGWTTGVLARDAAGNKVDINSPDAVAWSAYGALDFAAGIGTGNPDFDGDAYMGAVEALMEVTGARIGVDVWADKQTKEAVVDAFDRAIKGGDRT